jgi:hypothetical protein
MTHNPAAKGELHGIAYEILDLTKLSIADFTPGFYYTITGDGTVEEPVEHDEDAGEAITLEGPYATLEEASQAVAVFVALVLEGAAPVTDKELT